MPELFIEILSEEIPARMQGRAADDLKRLVLIGLKEAGLKFLSAESFVTPRRLILVVDGIPKNQPDVREERRGPKADAPNKAIQGFLAANGLTIDQVERRKTQRGTFLFAARETSGRSSTDVLHGIIEGVLAAFPWPKSMRWGGYRVRWVRPMHSMVCLFDGNVIPARFGPVTAGNTTCGHRFMAPAAFAVCGFADYRDKLRAAKVMVDAAERRALIVEAAAVLAADVGLGVKADPGLLDEVAGLVEWPVVLIGHIGEDFMSLPPEVLTGAMRAHQKYFALLTPDGGLAPRFIVVANMETKDGGKAVTVGNERVLRARLSDARYFWDQDRSQTLASRVLKLGERIFHAKLGTDGEKAERLAKLAPIIAAAIPGCDKGLAARASRYAKADLTTEMVGEFPELQGLMGQYYALNDGEDASVAEAIASHYSPVGPGDACPTAPVSVAVALADKMDTLVGFFGIDEKPTGSKDPFALRRAGLGVIRLIIENGLRLPLGETIRESYQLYAVGGINFRTMDRDEPVVEGELLAFLADRLKVHLREQGVRHDLISAVFALGGEDDLVRLLSRVSALQSFLSTKDGSNLLTAYKRASNIVRIEEKKDGTRHDGAVDPDLLKQAEERALFDRLEDAVPRIDTAVASDGFVQAMAVLAELRVPIDAFFDEVTVNSDDMALRANRLRLLSRIYMALGGVADFSRIEG